MPMLPLRSVFWVDMMKLDTGHISIDELLQSKALSEVSADTISVLARVQELDVSDFNEAEVRTFVIDPIVRALGYAKGAAFSADLERPIAFLDTRKRPDYRLNLWQENFWLIEAKRPRSNETRFGYADLAQALEYACHPEINAALVVLCDGEKIEIFDREQSVTEPVLCLKRANLVAEFDKLRSLLEPWQVWFFQKRRVARLIDKVFSKEFNLSRVDEFKRLVNGRLEGLRSTILENYRATDKDDMAEEREIGASPLIDLIEGKMFLEHSHPVTSALIKRLGDLSIPNSFTALHRIFPDHPRDANEMFLAHATVYLMALGERVEKVGWLPAWLSDNSRTLDSAVKVMVRHCLTFFESDESRRVILLAGAALRRVQKLLFMTSETQWSQAELMHSAYRYLGREQDWGQFLASPHGQASGILLRRGIIGTSRFVTACQREDGQFNVEIAKLRLKEIWRVECALLAATPNYAALRKERALGDMGIAEVTSVTYDELGHTLLCLLKPYPKWHAYILEHHRRDLEVLTSFGSWSAMEMLSVKRDARVLVDDRITASRFFLDDIDTFQTLRDAYAD